jgi:HlyD family secretion protein
VRIKRGVKLAGVAVLAAMVALVAGLYLRDRPLLVNVARIEENVPIQVFGLGTVDAQTVSKIGFETGWGPGRAQGQPR